MVPILVMSCLMGLVFGLIFGIMDMEDVSIFYFKDKLSKEENYCFPIGVLFGGISGFVATYYDNNVTIS